MSDREGLPWEVRFLLRVADADYDTYAACLDCLIEDARAGEMPATELRRFKDAMALVAEEHKRDVLRLKRLTGHPTVEFENGQWRIT
jgi:hypothetical protein